MRAGVAYESGAHEKTVAVVLDAAAVVVEKNACLNRVAFGDKILSEYVCDIDVLRSLVEAIQPAVGIFFELMKVCEVELITVVAESAEETRAQVIIRIDKAAKVGDERLYACANGDEVVISICIREFHFAESLFERELCIRASSAATNIYIEDAVFTRARVVRQ